MLTVLHSHLMIALKLKLLLQIVLRRFGLKIVPAIEFLRFTSHLMTKTMTNILGTSTLTLLRQDVRHLLLLHRVIIAKKKILTTLLLQ